MDTRTGEIGTREELIRRGSNLLDLLKLTDSQAETLRPKNRQQRRAWAVQQRRQAAKDRKREAQDRAKAERAIRTGLARLLDGEQEEGGSA